MQQRPAASTWEGDFLQSLGVNFRGHEFAL